MKPMNLDELIYLLSNYRDRWGDMSVLNEQGELVSDAQVVIDQQENPDAICLVFSETSSSPS